MNRIPTKYRLCFRIICDECVGVPGPPTFQRYVQFSACDAFYRIYQLQNCYAFSCPEIEKITLLLFKKVFDRPYVCVRQITDMNVIPYAGTVARIIIRTEHRETFSYSQRILQQYGNNMGFRIVHLTHGAVRIRSCGIEISQADELQTVRFIVIFHNLLEHELRPPVRIHGSLLLILAYRYLLRYAVSGTGRRENDLLDSRIDDRIQKRLTLHHVVIVIFSRIGNRLAHIGQGCEVDDDVNILGFEQICESVRIAYISRDVFHSFE
ncbi:hypothetical protein SDC9_161271 [bioreactor metagenome]|uniref:Uncharacterized protein n=1 Tax=bioreactor metagenome TaxID=1076179 RepID=A0A645FHN9_9ZZZZ